MTEITYISVQFFREDASKERSEAHGQGGTANDQIPCKLNDFVLLLNSAAVASNQLLQSDNEVTQLRIKRRSALIDVVESKCLNNEGAKLVAVVFK